MRGDVTLTAAIGGAAADAISGTITGLMQSPVADSATPGGSSAAWTAGRLPQTVELVGAYDNGVTGVAPVLATTGAISTASADFDDFGVAHGALAATAAVGADGSFRGTARPLSTATNADRWELGEYEGALYGPTTALEAAGTWWLQADRDAADVAAARAIIGSFGAVCMADCR